MQRDNGITMFEYLVMAMLSEAPGRTLQLKRLATVVNGSLSRLSHVVTRLEKRDWVRREPLPANGRITMATLTDAGFAKVVASAPSHVRTVRELVFAQLDRDQVSGLAEISDAAAAAARHRLPAGAARPQQRRQAGLRGSPGSAGGSSGSDGAGGTPSGSPAAGAGAPPPRWPVSSAVPPVVSLMVRMLPPAGGTRHPTRPASGDAPGNRP